MVTRPDVPGCLQNRFDQGPHVEAPLSHAAEVAMLGFSQEAFLNGRDRVLHSATIDSRNTVWVHQSASRDRQPRSEGALRGR